MKRYLLAVLLFCMSAFALASRLSPAAAGLDAQSAQDGQALFRQKCAACHTIGSGRLVGPDLQGVTRRRDLNWLHSFISAPDKMIASGDLVAQQLLAENNQVPMPNLGLSEAYVAALLAYLENPGGVGAAPTSPAASLPGGDAEAGRRLFIGQTTQGAGGPACLACHTVQGVVPLGGGGLGPDLTHVLQRYGEAGLTANLNQITFPTMAGPFLNKPLSPQEQADLIAYFKASDALPPPTALVTPGTWFSIIGAGLTLLLFVVMLAFRPRWATSAAERVRRGRGAAQSV